MAFIRFFGLHHLIDTGVHIAELVFFEWTASKNNNQTNSANRKKIVKERTLHRKRKSDNAKGRYAQIIK